MVTKRRRPGLVIFIVIVLVVVGFFIFRPKAKSDVPTVKTAKVTRGTVTASVSGTGVLKPLSIVSVKSNVGGQVIQLAVDEGDEVHKGQLIAKIDPSDSMTNLEQTQADYAGAQAKVNQTKQNKNMQGQQTAETIRGNEQAVIAATKRLEQAVKQAQVQPQISDAAIRQAQSSLTSAEASLKQTTSALTPQKLAAAQYSYDQAKASLDQVQANLDQAQASLDQAGKNYTRQKALFDKGFMAKSTVESAEQQLEVAKAQVVSAKAQIVSAKAQVVNVKNKLDTVQGEAAEDINVANARVDQAKAALSSAQMNRKLDDLKQQDVDSARAALKQATAALASAKAGLIQNSMRAEDIVQAQAQFQRSKAAVTNAVTQVGYTTITAPCDGVVIAKYVELGSIVQAGRSSTSGTGAGVSLVDIADIKRMQIDVEVDETDISQIEVGQTVDITIDAYPNELFDGRVVKIAPQATAAQNVTTIPVTVEITSPDKRLKPVMNATCDFITEKKPDVLMVPNEAVKENNNGYTVTVMEGDKQVTRKVEIGVMGNDATEITSGLKEGETVVTNIIVPTTTTGTGTSGGGGRGGPRMF